MEVTVYGSRIFDHQWEEARRCLKNDLPELSPEQRKAAQRYRISEEDYARQVLAQQLSTDRLLETTAKFGKLLEDSIRARGLDARVARIQLNDLRELYEIEVSLNGKRTQFTVDETVVKDLLERGSATAEASIARIIDLNLGQRVIS